MNILDFHTSEVVTYEKSPTFHHASSMLYVNVLINIILLVNIKPHKFQNIDKRKNVKFISFFKLR